MSIRKCCYFAFGVFGLMGYIAFAISNFRPRFRLEEQVTLKGRVGGVEALAFSPTGETIASGGEDKSINLWDMPSGKRILTLNGHAKRIKLVLFSPDGRILASSDSNSIKLWDVGTGKQIATCDGCCAAFSPDGKTIAVAIPKGPIKIYDETLAKQTALLEGHRDWVHAMSFSPDGTLLASGGQDQMIKLWDVTDNKLRATLDNRQYVAGGKVKSLAFSPDGKLLASESLYGYYRLWEVATGKMRAEFEPWWDTGTYVSFSPDGKTLAAGCREGVQLRGVASGWKRAALEFDHGWVWHIAFSPDGETVATAGYEGTVKLWKMVANK